MFNTSRQIPVTITGTRTHAVDLIEPVIFVNIKKTRTFQLLDTNKVII